VEAGRRAGKAKGGGSSKEENCQGQKAEGYIKLRDRRLRKEKLRSGQQNGNTVRKTEKNEIPKWKTGGNEWGHGARQGRKRAGHSGPVKELQVAVNFLVRAGRRIGKQGD